MQLQTVLGLILVIPLSLAHNDTLKFLFVRHSQQDNNIELICRNETTQERIEDPKFYVNTTFVLGQELLTPTANGHLYHITGDREGSYSCGVDRPSSNVHVLLASPVVDDTIQTNYSSRVGGEVTLECPIPRGAMQAHYNFQWKRNLNAITSSDKIRITFNGSRFKLTILDTPASANGSYLCKATVFPPVGNTAFGEASVHLHVSAAVSPSVQLSTTTPVAYSSQLPKNSVQPTLAPVRPFVTGKPSPPSSTGTGTGLSPSLGVLIAIIILIIGIIIAICVIVIAIIVKYERRVVAHRRHNHWAVEEARRHPEIAEIIGRLTADDEQETQPQTEENGV